MKKFNVIYNHNIFDAPYNQREVRNTEKFLKERFGEDVEIIISKTSFQSPNPFYYDADFIMVEHTFDLTTEEKKDLANIIKKGVTKLKSSEPIDVIVSLRKISDDDLYFFEA